MFSKKTSFLALSMTIASSASFAEKEVQDMSDPLAVYTQGGIGLSNKGHLWSSTGLE